jgi:hypothetical protein
MAKGVAMGLEQFVNEVRPAHSPTVGMPHHLLHGGRTRRDFLRDVGVGGAGLAVFGTLGGQAAAAADSGSTARPKPIAGDPALAPFRVFLPSAPGEGHEPSVITDFNGDIGLCQVQGTGMGSDSNTWFFDADMRFMQGDYLTADDSRRRGTFGFV